MQYRLTGVASSSGSSRSVDDRHDLFVTYEKETQASHHHPAAMNGSPVGNVKSITYYYRASLSGSRLVWRGVGKLAAENLQKPILLGSRAVNPIANLASPSAERLPAD